MNVISDHCAHVDQFAHQLHVWLFELTVLHAFVWTSFYYYYTNLLSDIKNRQ